MRKFYKIKGNPQEVYDVLLANENAEKAKVWSPEKSIAEMNRLIKSELTRDVFIDSFHPFDEIKNRWMSVCYDPLFSYLQGDMSGGPFATVFTFFRNAPSNDATKSNIYDFRFGYINKIHIACGISICYSKLSLDKWCVSFVENTTGLSEDRLCSVFLCGYELNETQLLQESLFEEKNSAEELLSDLFELIRSPDNMNLIKQHVFTSDGKINTEFTEHGIDYTNRCESKCHKPIDILFSFSNPNELLTKYASLRNQTDNDESMKAVYDEIIKRAQNEISEKNESENDSDGSKSPFGFTLIN